MLARSSRVPAVDLINADNLPQIARELAESDSALAVVVSRHGSPPLWARPAGFATLLQIILEQQVSLASAKACFDKLSLRTGGVTPEGFLNLTDAELKEVGFSRQKSAYARHLSGAALENRINLEGLQYLPDEQVKTALTRL